MPHSLFRTMLSTDLDLVLNLQAQAYGPGFLESRTAFLAKIETYPDTNWIAQENDKILAYLFAQPACLGYPPPLDDLATPVEGPDSLHLHDLSVSPLARGRGLARGLCAQALARGRQAGYAWATLVAVQNSVPFWQQHGFSLARPEKSLASYGMGAAYLIQRL